MDDLIPLVVKLQQAFNSIASRQSIELPVMVSVGAQSAGKSSVIESIVGRDFLPRGNGIVTRCPLILQLKRIDASQKDWAVFGHLKDQKFFNFEEVRNEIDNSTDRIAGASGKCLSDTPIYLTINSSNVVDLTLVDLPGLTKVPVQGQPSDVESQISALIMKFIKQQNALILAISPANTDLANSDALKMARQVDPRGERTIGVITKIDLMDEGLDAWDLLKGDVYPLKLGYYGVKCRSQKNIQDNISIQKALELEAEFYRSHSAYKDHADRLGVPYLSKKLNQILVGHIKKCLPTLNNQVNSSLKDKERELMTYKSVAESPLHRVDNQPLVLALIDKFLRQYEMMLEGQFVQEAAVAVQGGSRINFIFNDIFKKVMSRIDPFENLKDQDIQTAIKNAQAMSPGLFVPETAFEVLVKQQMSRLLEPSLDCAYNVYEELRKVVIEIKVPELAPYYRLQSKMCDVMENVLDKCLTPTCQMIMNLLEIENSHINTNHPDFIGSAGSLLNLFEDNNLGKDSSEMGQREGQEGVGQKNFSLLTKRSEGGNKLAIEGSNDDYEQDSRQPLEFNAQSQAAINQAKAQEAGLMQSQFVADNELQNQNLKESMFQSVFGYDTAQTPIHQQQKSMPIQKNFEDFGSVEQQLFMMHKKDASNLPAVILSQPRISMRASEHQESARVLMETRVVQNLIQSYFSIVKVTIADMVPKAVMAYLVNESKDTAHSELVAQIYKNEDLEALLAEDPITMQARKTCVATVKALKDAQIILAEVEKFRI